MSVVFVIFLLLQVILQTFFLSLVLRDTKYNERASET